MSQSPVSGLSYRDAGVNIDAGNALVERIKPHAKRTVRPESLGGIGGFGALFKLPEGYRQPVLVSGTDGVGTKLKLAIDYQRHQTIGQDLVAMCVNDLLVANAEPLFFLDYYATGQLDVEVAAQVVASIADGCVLANCTLAGGETAEMPGMYQPGDYDLAGFCVGIAEHDQLIDGSKVSPGDLMIGLPASGPHSNGYSLIRKIFEANAVDPEASSLSATTTLLDAVMKPTRIYVSAVRAAMATGYITGAVHITGGGFQENLPRSFGAQCAARVDLDAWQRPLIFQWLNQAGQVGAHEMLRTFNCGIGFVLFCRPEHHGEILNILEAAGEQPQVIGEITARDGGDAVTFTGTFT